MKKLIVSSLASSDSPNSNLLTRSAFILILTTLMLGFNLHSRQQVKVFNSASLLDKIFNQVEELTVIEAAAAQGPQGTKGQLLAALETTAPPASQTNTSTEEVSLVAGANGALVRPNLASSRVATRDQVIVYQIQPGDTISTIAESYGISTATILWANHLSAHSIIRPGEQLKILPVSGIMHIVQSGETLSGIAKKYDVPTDKIAEANELVSEHQLQIKQGLIIPGAQPPQVKTRTTQLANFSRLFTSSPATPSSSGFIWPTPSSRITQYYWVRHRAVDIGGTSNHSILASQAGRVEYAGWTSGYGYNVVLNHGSGVKTRYAHLRQLWVKPGQQIEQGEALGKMGSTGRSTGVHLHFEIELNDRLVNPLSYL